MKRELISAAVFVALFCQVSANAMDPSQQQQAFKLNWLGQPVVVPSIQSAQGNFASPSVRSNSPSKWPQQASVLAAGQKPRGEPPLLDLPPQRQQPYAPPLAFNQKLYPPMQTQAQAMPNSGWNSNSVNSTSKVNGSIPSDQRDGSISPPQVMPHVVPGQRDGHVPDTIDQLIGGNFQLFKRFDVRHNTKELYMVRGQITDNVNLKTFGPYLRIKLNPMFTNADLIFDTGTDWKIRSVNRGVMLVDDPRIEFIELRKNTFEVSSYVWDLTIALDNSIQVKCPDGAVIEKQALGGLALRF